LLLQMLYTVRSERMLMDQLLKGDVAGEFFECAPGIFPTPGSPAG
jgi:hypothetical protein